MDKTIERCRDGKRIHEKVWLKSETAKARLRSRREQAGKEKDQS
jgi:hypothetical protein